MERNGAENDTNDEIAAEGLGSLSVGTCENTNNKAFMKAPDASPGKFSTGDERDRQRKHNRQSHNIPKRQKLTLAGQAHKAKYELLRTRQKERLFESRMKCLLQTKSLFAESHTEALHRVEAEALRFQQQTWYESRMKFLLQTKPLSSETHTEALHRVEAAAALMNQQQTWSDNATGSEAWVRWFQNSEGFGGKMEFSRPE